MNGKLHINLGVTLASGAEVKLTEKQQKEVDRAVESIVLNTPQEQPTVKRKKRRRTNSWMPWKVEEDVMVLQLMELCPAGTKGRTTRIKELAKDLGRTVKAVKARIHNLKNNTGS